jgi:predicted RND superfamily exporter protein
MWNSLSSFIIKFRILFLFIIAGVTFFMAQNAVNVEYSVERAKILPSSHQV